MNDVRNLLKEALGDSRPSVNALDETKKRVHRREVNRRIAAGTLAVAVFVGAAVYAWSAFRTGEGAHGSASTPTPPATIEPLVTDGPIYYRDEAPDETGRIHAVEPDGTGERVAFPADSLPSAGQFAWSADGRKIAFDGYYGDHEGISTAAADGSSVRSITDGPNDLWPSWSPDGQMIVFASTRYDPSVEGCPTGIDLRCPTDIYVMDVDGSAITRLTTDPSPEWDPVWSPDGTQIAFVKGESEVEVFVMNTDGSDVRRVTSTEGGSGFAPSWSPDGSKIVFGSIQYEDWGIFVVDADGTNEHALLFENSVYATNPAWSPDGDQIVFAGSIGGAEHLGLYVIDPDGSDVTRVASSATAGNHGVVAWQPLLG
jgi:TolB protein